MPAVLPPPGDGRPWVCRSPRPTACLTPTVAPPRRPVSPRPLAVGSRRACSSYRWAPGAGCTSHLGVQITPPGARAGTPANPAPPELSGSPPNQGATDCATERRAGGGMVGKVSLGPLRTVPCWKARCAASPVHQRRNVQASSGTLVAAPTWNAAREKSQLAGLTGGTQAWGWSAPPEEPYCSPRRWLAGQSTCP